MDQKSMVKQAFDFQKNTFDSFIDSVATIQDQAEQSLSFYLDRNPLMPEESKKVVMEWGNIYRKSRDDFKQALDDGYDGMESYFETAAQATQQAARQATKSAAEAGRKSSEAASKASESGKQESRQH